MKTNKFKMSTIASSAVTAAATVDKRWQWQWQTHH